MEAVLLMRSLLIEMATTTTAAASMMTLTRSVESTSAPPKRHDGEARSRVANTTNASEKIGVSVGRKSTLRVYFAQHSSAQARPYSKE